MAAPESHPIAADRPAPSLPACRVRRVVQYIDDNLQNSIRLVELSALVHMSPYHFARLFAGSTGAPPHRFILERRMERARSLLAGAGVPIAIVARSVGFRTASHFTTMFRRLVGMTPSAYRTVISNATQGAADAEPSAATELGQRPTADREVGVSASAQS